MKTNIQSIEAQWGYIQSFSFPFLKIIFYFFISGTLDSCPNTKTIGDRCKFTETHTSCIKSSAIESTSQLPEEGHFCQNGESSYAQCNGGCLDENSSKYKSFSDSWSIFFRLHSFASSLYYLQIHPICLFFLIPGPTGFPNRGYRRPVVKSKNIQCHNCMSRNT